MKAIDSRSNWGEEAEDREMEEKLFYSMVIKARKPKI